MIHISKQNYKYVSVLILFVIILIFGKNFTPADEGATTRIKLMEKEINNIKKGIYTIKPESKPITTNTPTSYQKGDSIRLLFDIQTDTNNISQTYEDRPLELSLYLISDYGEKELIDNFKVQIPTANTLHEVKFTSSFDSSKLLIERNDTRTTGDLVVSGVSSYRLNIGSSGLNSLKPTISGNPDLQKIVFSTASNFTGSFPNVFTRSKQLIGQIFSPNSDQVSSVDIALAWRGAGGAGDYLVELREVSDSGGYFEALAHYYFNQETLQDLSIGGGVYRIPLVANLVQGKKYLFSINNNTVKFNLLNTLKVGSSGGQVTEGSGALTTIGNGKDKSIGQLFMQVHGLECFKYKDQCVLNRATIQDIGGGSGLYSYESAGEPIDFLDLYKSDPKTSFDNKVGGIIAPVSGGASFYYKFDTIYPYRTLKVVVDQNVINASKNQLSYSLDNLSWIPINQNDDGNPIIKQIITPPSSQQTELFIKVTYDPADALYKQSAYFGIKSIKTQASLIE